MAPKGRGFHEPVMTEEVLFYLDPRGAGLFMDGTVGGGGHAWTLLDRCASCRLLAVDRDPDAIEEARGRLVPFGDRVRFIAGRFDRVTTDPEVQARGLDGVLLDLGVSSWQLDRSDRGFAFQRGVALDMRMESTGLSAADLLAGASEPELGRIFREYGEVRRWRSLAREIVRRRRTGRPLESSDDLVGVLYAANGRAPTQKDKARAFQALRIAVNEELDALTQGLPALRDVMNDGARLIVLSYHSLEDRLVKRAFQEWSDPAGTVPGDLPAIPEGLAKLGETITRGAVKPSAEEVRRNPRARSARLRAWRKSG